jgi:hypothetical protein
VCHYFYYSLIKRYHRLKLRQRYPICNIFKQHWISNPIYNWFLYATTVVDLTSTSASSWLCVCLLSTLLWLYARLNFFISSINICLCVYSIVNQLHKTKRSMQYVGLRIDLFKFEKENIIFSANFSVIKWFLWISWPLFHFVRTSTFICEFDRCTKTCISMKWTIKCF